MFPTTVMAAPNSVGKYWARLSSYGMYDHLSHLMYITISFYNSTNSKMTNVRLDKFGQCHKIHYPNEVVEEDEDLLEIEHDVEDEEDDIDDEEYIARKKAVLNFLDEGAEVKCYGPPASRPCPEGRIPYTCAAGGEMCCEWSDLGNVQTRKRNKNQRLKDRINLPGYGSCTRDDIPTADSEDQIMIS